MKREYDILHNIIWTIGYDMLTLPSRDSSSAEYCVPSCLASFQIGAFGRVKSAVCFWHDKRWWCSVCTMIMFLFVPPEMEDKASHREILLVFFSTSEPITLTPGGYIQRNSFPLLYKRAASPSRNPEVQNSRRMPVICHSYGSLPHEWHIPGTGSICLAFAYLAQSWGFPWKCHMTDIYMAYAFMLFVSYVRHMSGICLIYASKIKYCLQLNHHGCQWDAAGMQL